MQSIKDLSERLFDEEKMYRYIEDYAKTQKLHQTLSVLPYAKEQHKNQFRKGKEKVPYIYHPLLVSCHAIALGLDDDNLLCAALLHDVCEDCDVPADELPVNEKTKEIVALLTKTSVKYEGWEEEYYLKISKNPKAALIKLIDRCNNVSSMAAVFSKEKMKKYIEETEHFIYPLLEKTKKSYPEYEKQIFLIQYHIISVVESIKSLLYF